jgi:hypothetical protein
VTDLADLVDRTTTRWLEATLRHNVNKVSGVFTTTATSLTFTYSQALDRGDLVGIEQEIVHTWAYDSSSKTAMVERGWRGTTATQHADGTVADVKARYFRSDVLGALRDEIGSWPTTLYQVVPAQTTVARGQSTITLPAVLDGCYGLIDARYNIHPLTVVVTGSSDMTTFDRWPRLTYARLAKSMPTASFSSGTALQLGMLASESTTVVLIAAMPFDISTFNESTTVDSLGLSESMTDLACMGAAIRLIHGGEAGRLDRTAQGESRRAQEVPPGAATQAAFGLERRYTNRLRSETQRLQSDFPIRIR